MANLLDSVKEYLTPELIGQAATLLGENENGISKAVGSIAPTILAGLLEKSNEPRAVESIFNALRNFDAGILNNLGSLLGGGNLAHNDPKDASGQLLSTIFGAKVPALTNAVASFSGVKQSSASNLLGLAGPIVMGLLSKKISSDGLNASTLFSLLLSQKNQILGMLPSGIASLLGAGSSGSVAGSASGKSTEGMGWLWPLLLLLGLGAAVVFYMKNCTAKPAVEVAQAPVLAPVVAPAQPVVEKFSLRLPTGYEVVGNMNGIEAQLLKFIQDPAAKISKDIWFDFDNLLFETASDQLNMAKSSVQLTNVYQILKAYPNVKIKMGGYTDNVGDAAKNKALSDRRAKNVLAELVKMGIAATRMEAEGYGQEHPVADNANEAGRAKNRRVSVSVRAK